MGMANHDFHGNEMESRYFFGICLGGITGTILAQEQGLIPIPVKSYGDIPAKKFRTTLTKINMPLNHDAAGGAVAGKGGGGRHRTR